MTARCIRARQAHKVAPSKLCSQRPGFRKDPGLFVFLSSLDRPARSARRQRSTDRATKTRWMLFENSAQDHRGTGRWRFLHKCGCSSIGRARHFQRRGHEFDSRHPLHDATRMWRCRGRRRAIRKDSPPPICIHFGCAHALRCRTTWCWRCGMCASLETQVTCSETPHPTGCSRVGTTEVETYAPVAQLAEQPFCNRQAARSNRRRGRQNFSTLR